MLDTVKRTISDYMMLETSENVLVALSAVRIPQRFC